jgi:hypothetical protein
MKFRLNENNTKLQLIESTKDEYAQLKLSFSKYVKDYYFKARYKMTNWDGRIEFLKSNKLNFGLWYEAYKICKEYGYPFIIENKDQFPINKSIKKEDVEAFCKDFYSNHKLKEDITKSFNLYEHQIEAVYKILKHRYGLVEVATAGGKSLVFGTLVFYYLKNINPDAKFLLIVPSIGLVTQFYNDLMDYNLGFHMENKIPSDIKIDEIMSDKPRKHFGKDPNIYIGTYQSLEKWPDEFFKQFEVVGVDECLHPDTMIKTKNGEKKISDIYKGDLVYTINEETGEKEIKEVDFIYKNISKTEQMFEIEMENGEKVKITGNHQVILKNRERKRVDRLNENDEIFDFNL